MNIRRVIFVASVIAGVALLPAAVRAEDTTTTTTIVENGCAPAPTVQAVFIGKVESVKDGVVRLEVKQMRAGSLSGYAVKGEVDVYYNDDAEFLRKGKTYIVGANPDSITNRLSSKVRESTPLFGGADVAGVDGEVVCPKYEDPVRTLNLNGTSVESGVLTGFLHAKKRILASVLAAMGVVFGGLFVVVVFKRSMDGASRASARKRAQRPRSSGSRTPPPQARPHA